MRPRGSDGRDSDLRAYYSFDRLLRDSLENPNEAHHADKQGR